MKHESGKHTLTAAAPLRIFRVLANAVIILLALGTLGSFLPAIPAIGELGPVLTANLGIWIVILALIGAVIVFRHWYANRRSRTLVLLGMAIFAALGSACIDAWQMGVAKANGAHIDLVEAMLAGSQQDDRLRPITVIYARHEGHGIPLDIYRPAYGRGGPVPVFVYVHGGGWGAETLKQRQADYRWFAERGYLVISLEYPPSSDTRHTWNVAEPLLGCAMTWIGANAANYGGDPARLALWGESAGGNLVLNLSYRANAGTLTPSCEGKVPLVAATIALYPVVDPARMYRPIDQLLGQFGRMMGDNYTGGSPEQFPDRYTAIASATHITGKAPATLLIIPEADHLVAPEAAYAFAAKARNVGVDTRVVRMPYAEHGFDLRSGSIGNQFVRQAILQAMYAHGLKPPL